jgi:hypothetical protein
MTSPPSTARDEFRSDVAKKVRKIAAKVVRVTQRANPQRWFHDLAVRTQRRRAEDVLAVFGQTSVQRFKGTVLVDGMWDNPNYWVRYTLLRAALGLNAAREIGILGPHSRKVCDRTFKRLGIRENAQFDTLGGDLAAHRHQAVAFLAGTKTPADILTWKLPYDLPAELLYDGLLKRQRAACVNLKDPMLVHFVTETLSSLSAADKLLDLYSFDLVVLSHVINAKHSALAWLAIKKKIPVVLLFGNYGVLRFSKILEPKDMFRWMDRFKPSDIIDLKPEREQQVGQAGQTYLDKRLAGKTDDIGARYAYQKRVGQISRAEIVNHFRWDANRPIVTVYAANWFDYPHVNGSVQFRDFLDWFEVTLAAAAKNKDVYWLLKPHPCDDWYGGITLRDLLPPSLASHVRMVEPQWNASALMECVDALVTCQGTAGIEYAAFAKPVLLADCGWYHELGFAKWSKTRAEYIAALSTRWWDGLPLQDHAKRARIFAGWYFCRPEWQHGFTLLDDSVQNEIYTTIPALFRNNAGAVSNESAEIREWFSSDDQYYHRYKIMRANSLAI